MKMQKQDIYRVGLPNLIPPLDNTLHQNIKSSLNFLGMEPNDFFISNIKHDSVSICFYNKQRLLNLLNDKNSNIESWFSKLGNSNYQELGNNILEIKISHYL